METNKRVITGAGNLVGGSATLQATARSKTNLSVLHLFSACLFSRELKKLEAEHLGKEFGPFWEDILAYATGSVLLTVAALESYVNELFSDRDMHFPGIRTDLLVKLWESHEQKAIVDKFDLALLLRQAAPIDRGSYPAHDVALLIRLRNALTHFKPEWFDEQVDHAKLSGGLATRFVPSSFLPKDEPIFPRAWATWNCTSWGIKAAIDFVDALESRALLIKRFEKFRSRFVYE